MDVSGRDGTFAVERPPLLGLAYRIFPKYDDAEEFVQEA